MPFRNVSSLVLLLVATTAWTSLWYARGTAAWQVGNLEARRGALEVAIAALEPAPADPAEATPIAAVPTRWEAPPVAAAPTAPSLPTVQPRALAGASARTSADRTRRSVRRRSGSVRSTDVRGTAPRCNRVSVVVSGVDAVVFFGDCDAGVGEGEVRAEAEITLTLSDALFDS